MKQMVQGIDIIDIDVAFLTYSASRIKQKPYVKLDSVCTAGIFELKKHRDIKRRQKYDIGHDAYKHYKWYNSSLRETILNHDTPKNTKLRISHWHIESGNDEAFRMNGILFKAVSIIISPDFEYWYCANLGPNAAQTNGKRLRVVKYLEEGGDENDYDEGIVADSIPKGPKGCNKEVCANNCNECINGRYQGISGRVCTCRSINTGSASSSMSSEQVVQNTSAVDKSFGHLYIGRDNMDIMLRKLTERLADLREYVFPPAPITPKRGRIFNTIREEA